MEYGIVQPSTDIIRELRDYVVVVRVRYTEDQFDEDGIISETMVQRFTYQVKASSVEGAREQGLDKAHLDWPQAGLVVRSVTMLERGR